MEEDDRSPESFDDSGAEPNLDDENPEFVSDRALDASEPTDDEVVPEPTPEPVVPAQAAKPRAKRLHPYRHEESPHREGEYNPRKVAFVVLGVASFMVVAGLWLQGRYGYTGSESTIHEQWETWTRIPLFAGLALLGIGLLKRPWARQVTMAGWILFGAYWAMTSRDLLIREGQDYVNFVFAMIGVFLTVWLAYHLWLDGVRGTNDRAVRFLQISVFVAAGFYFLVDKIQMMRSGLISIVGSQTKWGLDVFGQGSKKGLVFMTDITDPKAPTTFFYPDYYCDPLRGDGVGRWCAENGFPRNLNYPEVSSSLLDKLLFHSPGGEDLLIVPVNIILACTALQSIMLFVGLFAGTDASWQKKVKWSLIVGGIVYLLNLVRNVGIIWFYGQGEASFWVMHNAIGKGGSLLAILAIAFAVFKYFPEFLNSLLGVLDLTDRDGPLERALRIGRRRPAPEELLEG